MAQKLGICVATKGRMEDVLGLTKAATAAGKEVEVFMTGEGVQLTTHPKFKELVEVAKVGSANPNGHVTVCEVSFIANGFKDKNLPGMRDKDFVTQGRNAEMVEQCDRYVVI